MFSFKIEPYVKVQTLIAGCLSIGEIVNGFGVSWSAPILPKLQDLGQSPLPYLPSQTHQSWLASIIYCGCVGSFIAGFLANKIGRKKTLLIGGILNFLAYVMLTTARNLTVMIIARFFIGSAMAASTITCLMYVGEIASPNIRGIILTTMAMFHAAGGLLAYSVGPFISYAGVEYVVMSLNVLYIVTCYFLPESPMFYVIKDDEASAISTLQFLGRDSDIISELKAMMERCRQKQQQKHIWRELLTVKSNKFSLFITICLCIFQQSSGIMAVIFFATTIFRDAGSAVRPDIATIIVGATFAIGSCISPFFIEKYGRRVLLMISTAGCSVSMTVLGVYFYLKMIEHPYVGRLGWLPLTSLVSTLLMYSVGLTIIPNTLAGELFTPKVRGLGPSISITCGWLSGLLSTTAFSYGVVVLGSHVAFWIFACINAVAFLFVITFVPETKGKSLMEIQVMLENRRLK